MSGLAFVSPPVFGVMALCKALQAQFAGDEALATVLDPALAIESTTTSLRAIRTATKVPAPTVDPKEGRPSPYPLFSYNYTQINRDPTMGWKAVQKASARDPDDPKVQFDYYAVIGFMDVSWALFHSDVMRLELYEGAYAARARMSNLLKITSKLPLVGDLDYLLDWGTLDSKLIQNDPIDVKAITGVVRIRGTFIVYEKNPSLFVDRLYLDARDWSARDILARQRFDFAAGKTTSTFFPEGKIPAADYNEPPAGFKAPV